MGLRLPGLGGGGGGGTVDAVARGLIGPVVGTSGESVPAGDQVFSAGQLWQNSTAAAIVVPASVTKAEMTAAGFTPVTPGSGEATTFVAAKPLAATGVDNDQAFISGGVLQSMVFQRTAGAWTYAGQFGSPKRTTVYSVTDRNAIGAELPAGGNFWFVLLQVDGTNNPGWYSVDSDGIQSGPFVGASPVTGTLREATDFVAAKPANTVGTDGDQVVVSSGVLESMVFERVAGVWTYRCQLGSPKRTSIYSVTDRTAVAAELSAGTFFSYLLLQDDGASLKGWYFIDDSGGQSGPL